MPKVMQSSIQFNGTLRDRAETTRIVIHHSDSAPDTTVEQVHGWHLNKEWMGIGYHYLIRGNGEIWEGRPEGKIGAHAYQDATHQANSDGIGICLAGAFESNNPTTEQLNSLVELIKDIQNRRGNLAVIRHSDVQATACPGALFPYDWLLNTLAGVKQGRTAQDIMSEAQALGLIVEDHDPDAPSPKWFTLQTEINLYNKLKGDK